MFRAFFSYLLKNQFIAGILFVATVYFMFVLREILMIIFISYIIMAALSPAVAFLRKKRVPKNIAVFITFFTTLVFFLMLIAPLVPFFTTQIQQLSKGFPVYLNEAAAVLGLRFDMKQFSQLFTIQQLGQNAFALAGGVFGGFFAIVTVLAISFYLLLDYDKIDNTIAFFVPKKYHPEITDLISQVNDKLGAWLRGQLLLSLSIGILAWIVLTAFQLPFALPLAVLAGLLEIVPTIGPIMSAVPAVIVGLTISPNMAIIIIVSYLIIQTLENNLLVPRIMQRAVGLNPIAVIVGIVVGGQLLGIPGALLSVPFISLIVLVFKSVNEQFES